MSTISISALAQSYYTLTTTIDTLGAQGTGDSGQLYVQPATNPQNCVNSVIYGATGAIGSAQFATALAAFYAGRSVRIDYTQASTGICTFSIIGGY